VSAAECEKSALARAHSRETYWGLCRKHHMLEFVFAAPQTVPVASGAVPCRHSAAGCALDVRHPRLEHGFFRARLEKARWLQPRNNRRHPMVFRRVIAFCWRCLCLPFTGLGVRTELCQESERSSRNPRGGELAGAAAPQVRPSSACTYLARAPKDGPREW